MITPVRNVNFKVYNPNFAGDNLARDKKVINFQEIQRPYRTLADFSQEELFGSMKKAANAVQLCEKTMHRRDNMAEEVAEILDAYRFGSMIDYADEMDDENISFNIRDEWQDVIITNDDGTIKSKGYYKNGVLYGLEKHDGNGNETMYDISYLNGEKTLTFDIKKRTYGKDNNYTALKLVLRDGKPYSYTDKEICHPHSETDTTYDRRLYFSSFDGRPIRYEEDFKLLKNGKMQIGRVLKENSFQSRYTQYADGSEKADAKVVFAPDENGHIKKLSSFTNALEIKASGAQNFETRLAFDEKGRAKSCRKGDVIVWTAEKPNFGI